MLHDGQPIEFPVEMIGAEQDLGSGPIIRAHGRGVETATHKYIFSIPGTLPYMI